MNFLRAFSHLFYPRLCLGCGDDNVAYNELICFRCHAVLPYTHFAAIRDNKTEKIFYGRVPIDCAMSLLYFSKGTLVQNLMHEIKYNGHRDLGKLMGRMIGRAIQDVVQFQDVDIIVPLPLSDKKKRQRGYNQSELLCDGISEIITKPVCNDKVLRLKHTDTQTRKHRRERWENVDGIFSINNAPALNGKHILLVDDVLTTGATLEACAAAILTASNARVSIATLAIATI